MKRLITILALSGIGFMLLTSQTTSVESVKKVTATNALTESLKTGANTFTTSSTGTFTWENGATFTGGSFFKAALDLESGTDFNPYSARLADIAGITYAQGDILYYNGTNIVKLAAGTSTYLLQSNGAGANPSWVAPQTSNLPRSYLAGLKLSNNGTDATNDIDIAVGACRGSADTANIVLASALTKRLDANWAAGTNQGMRYSGAAIADTTYHLWLVSDGSTVDVYAYPGSSGASSSTVLSALQAETGGSGYLYLRRIGAIIRAGATILPFSQDGDYFTLLTPVQDVSVTNLGTSRTTYTLASVPVGIRVRAMLRGYISHASAGTMVLVGDLNETDTAPSGTVAPLFRAIVYVAGGTGDVHGDYFTNTSAQIYARASATSTTLRLNTLGWEDRRGRDD